MNGETDPGSGDGTDGDFYINTATNWLFGPKDGNGWGAGVSLVGPEGPPGGGGDGWSLTGNAGTDPAVNFLGTTDAQALHFRVLNLPSGKIEVNSTASTGFGYNTLTNPSSQYSEAFGYQVLANATGSYNTAMGYFNLTSAAGSHNTVMGYDALRFATTGSHNVALGSAALRSTTSGFSNIAIGRQALWQNTDRGNLVAIGDSALRNNGVGAQPDNSIEGIYEAHDNVAVGSKALYTNNRGSSNTGIGTGALYANGFGSQNTAVGAGALRNTNNLSGNTGIGTFTLYNNVGGNYNTAVGASAGGTNSPSNHTAIGYVAGYVAGLSNEIEIGNTSVSWIGGQQNWSNYSDGRVKDRVQENVPGLAFIRQLRPVTYHFDLRKENELVYGDMEIGEWEGKYDLEKRQMTGFIAQEVEAAAKSCGYDFSGVRPPEGGAKLYSLTYAEFVVPLVKAVQEQQAMIERLTRRIAELERR